MIDWILNLLGSMLAWFESWSGSYAIALLFYALIFKIVFSPFSIKQQKNQIAMAKLTPKIAVIKEKYRGRTDQVTMRKQQEEIMALQQKEGYSPFSGCLPLLLQLPIIILLYNVIRSPLSFIVKLPDELVVNLYNFVNNATLAVGDIKSIDQITLVGSINSHIAQQGGGYIEGIFKSFLVDGQVVYETIPQMPNFNLWGMNLAQTPSFAAGLIVLIPFLTAIFQWLSMFISRKFAGNNQLQGEGDQAQMSLKIMDIVMPLMTLWMAFSFSAMMGLYWIYQSIFGIAQTIILGKLMPIPKYTEEELKAMRKAQKAQEKAQRNVIKSQPKYKSLHYIDDEDYEELPEIKAEKPKGGTDNKNIPEIKD